MEVAHESPAPKLAIVEDLEAEVFLAAENAEDLLILKVPEFLTIHSAPIRLQKLFRTQKAADLVGSIFKGHGLLFY
jgi:hypothetical protein